MEFHFNKAAGLIPSNLLKRDFNADFSCEISKICKNTYLEEQLRTTAPLLSSIYYATF